MEKRKHTERKEIEKEAENCWNNQKEAFKRMFIEGFVRGYRHARSKD